MATKDDDDSLMVATESFATELDGVPFAVTAGKTRVRRGHPLHAAKPESWETVDNSPSVETATAAPGEKRGAKASA